MAHECPQKCAGSAKTRAELKPSPATSRAKATVVSATDGGTFEAEDLMNGKTVACAYTDFPDHFGFSCRFSQPVAKLRADFVLLIDSLLL